MTIEEINNLKYGDEVIFIGDKSDFNEDWMSRFSPNDSNDPIEIENGESLLMDFFQYESSASGQSMPIRIIKINSSFGYSIPKEEFIKYFKSRSDIRNDKINMIHE